MKDRDAAVIESLYAAVAEPSGWSRALESLGGLFNTSGAALLYLDARTPGVDIALGTGLWDAAARAQYSEFAPHDPAPAAFARQPRGTVTTTSRMFTPATIRSGLFYNEFFLPLGLTDCAGAVLFGERGRFAMLGLQHGRERRAFTDGELRRVEGLLPHIARAFQLRATLMRAGAEARALAAVADRLTMGIAVITDRGGALHVNAALAAMAARGDGLKLDARGWLRSASREADRRLLALQTEVLGRTGPGGTVALPRPNDTRPYAVLVAPLPPGLGYESAAGETTSAGALVLVHDPAAAIPELPDELARLFGLTRGAARLAAALAAGHDLHSYAAREGLTVHTARFHLKTAFARLEVSTQAALVRVVVRALAELALARGG